MKPSTCRAAMFAAVLGLSGATAAAAQGTDPVFGAFQDVCVATGAETAAVTAATETHHWRPGDSTGTPIAGFTVTDKITKTLKISDSELKLFAWRGTKGAIKADECQVAVSKSDFKSLQAAATAAVGFAPQQAGPDKVVFQFTGPAGALKPITNSQFDEAAAGDGVMLLTISRQGGGGFLDLLRIRR